MTIPPPCEPCTTPLHERLKQNAAWWASLPFVGHQPDEDGDLELRNCTRGCRSTLVKEVP